MNKNQHITRATKSIAVSVINAEFGGETMTGIAESAIIVNFGTKHERVIGIQFHGRFPNGRHARHAKTNRAIACQIARQIRKREAAKAARG